MSTVTQTRYRAGHVSVPVNLDVGSVAGRSRRHLLEFLAVRNVWPTHRSLTTAVASNRLRIYARRDRPELGRNLARIRRKRPELK